MALTGINITGSGHKLINTTIYTSKFQASVGYSLPFNYLDGFVDFDSSEQNQTDNDLGFSQLGKGSSSQGVMGPLTHFNGVNSCNIGYFSTSAYPYNTTTSPQVRKFCHIKEKYISISGTSIYIGCSSTSPTYNGLSLNQDTIPQWVNATTLNNTTIRLMVEGNISNVKYFMTRPINASVFPVGSLGAVSLAWGDAVETASIFPMYFPKRDTLVLTNNKLDQV